MDVLRRGISGLLATGSRRTLMLATYDDRIAPSDADLEDVLHAVLGNKADITSDEAVEAIPARLRQCWTWTVVLKVLMILHYIGVAPQTPQVWLKQLFLDNSLLLTCRSFREEGGDNHSAHQHATLVRRYATFLSTFVTELTNPRSVLSKSRLLHYLGTPGCLKVAGDLFVDDDLDELLSRINTIRTVAALCVDSCLDEQDKLLVTVRVDDLTSAVFLRIYRECLRLFSLYNAVMVEYVGRTERFVHLEDVVCGLKTWDRYVSLTARMTALGHCIQAFPNTPPGIIGVAQPPKAVRKSMLKRLRALDHTYVSEDSSSV